MNRTKKAGLSVKSGLSLMCIVCLLCGLLCGFFWLAGENSAGTSVKCVNDTKTATTTLSMPK